MAKLSTDDFFKATVNNLLFYRYRNTMIVRTVSGFTKETRVNDPRYQNCTHSANEFGRVSSLCKQVRLALSAILPKQNNLAVVNSLTKIMRKVLEHDTINQRGERQLTNALATETGRQLLKGYQFNPDTTIALDYVLTNDSLTVTPKDLKFPKGLKHLGFRAHQLAFDFETGESALVSGEWVLENKELVLTLPTLSHITGVEFTILETQIYDDGSKSVIMV